VRPMPSASSPASTSWRVLALIVMAVAFAVLTMPILKLGIDAAAPHLEGTHSLLRFEDTGTGFSYDFGRISRRYLILVTVVAFVVTRRSIPWTLCTHRGLRRRSPALLFGVSLGSGLVCAYVALIAVSGQVAWARPAASFMIRKGVEFTLAALVIAFLEELFFRGILFRMMVADWGPCRALCVSSTVFAVLHCISGGYRVGPGWDPWIGMRLLKVYFTASDGSFIPDLRLIIGLFLLGCLASFLFLKTGSLWAPIGLHASIVLGSKLAKKALDRLPNFPDWLLGDQVFIVSGAACWVLLVLALVAAWWLAPAGPLYERIARRR
jgi:membrane protease YdiL (CAAX protease family)